MMTRSGELKITISNNLERLLLKHDVVLENTKKLYSINEMERNLVQHYSPKLLPTDFVDLEKNLKFNGSAMVPFSADEMTYFGNRCRNDQDYIEYLTPVLLEWHKLTFQENITYFLTAGALFGAFLQGRPIDCDTDLDVLVDYNDVPKLTKIQTKRNFSDFARDGVGRVVIQMDWMIKNDLVRRRFNCKGKRVNQLTDACSFQEPIGRFMYNTFYLDIFSYKHEGDYITDLIDGGTLHRNDIFPRKRCKIMDVETFCPKDTELFLRMHYGSDRVKIYKDHFENVRQIENAFKKLKS